ncbi:MAG TPA: hypothetical protein VFY40_08510 [Blastocatellia bacterium]|nr:hypothetical protein [Blastocatellia bacterium]
MIDYSDPNDPNFNPHWGDREPSSNGLEDTSDLSDFELEEYAEKFMQELREEELLQTTIDKPVE